MAVSTLNGTIFGAKYFSIPSSSSFAFHLVLSVKPVAVLSNTTRLGTVISERLMIVDRTTLKRVTVKKRTLRSLQQAARLVFGKSGQLISSKSSKAGISLIVPLRD